MFWNWEVLLVTPVTRISVHIRLLQLITSITGCWITLEPVCLFQHLETRIWLGKGHWIKISVLTWVCYPIVFMWHLIFIRNVQIRWLLISAFLFLWVYLHVELISVYRLIKDLMAASVTQSCINLRRASTIRWVWISDTEQHITRI